MASGALRSLPKTNPQLRNNTSIYASCCESLEKTCKQENSMTTKLLTNNQINIASTRIETDADLNETAAVLVRDWFADALKVLETQRLLLLVGEPGRSKTTFARWATGQLNGSPPLILQGSPEIDRTTDRRPGASVQTVQPGFGSNL